MSEDQFTVPGLFHAWFDEVREAVALVSPVGAVLAANPSLARLVGPKGAVGRSLLELVFAPPDAVDLYVHACLNGAGVVDGSLLISDGNHELVSCRCEGTVVELGAGNRYVLLRLFPSPRKISGQAEPARAAASPSCVEAGLLDGRVKDLEARLGLALEAGRMTVWEWDAETDEVCCPAGFGTIHGKPSDGFRGSLGDFHRDIHGEDRPLVLEAIRETIEYGQEYRAEYRVVWPDGSVHWVEDRGRLRFGDRGELRSLVAGSVLIDQRLELEQQLRERLEQQAHAEAHVRSVLETVPDGIITIDEKGMIATVNPAAEKIFGYTAEEVVGKNVNMLMPQPYRGQHDRYITNYLQTGMAKVIGTGREVVGLRKDGSAFPMEVALSEFQLEGRRHFTGVVRDVGERKRAENIAHFLADASRSLSTLVDYASTLQKVAYLAVPFFADWCTVHIAREDDTLQQLAVAHIDPDKSELAQELGKGSPLRPESALGPGRVFSSGRSQLIDEVSPSLIASVARDEKHRKLLEELGLSSYMGVPLAVRGDVFGVISFFSADSKRRYDLTDLAMAEDLAHRAAIAVENALLYRELRDADRRKDEFLAMLAHELRDPLAPLQSGLDVVALSGVEPETVQVMQQQVQHLVRTVGDLMDVSRIMRGKVELRRELVVMSTVVERAVALASPAIEAAGQTLHVAPPATSLCLYADPLRLVQVITNLLNNAAQFTGRGGNVRLAVRQEGETAVISVEDDGQGIHPDFLPHVFDLFTHLDRSPDRSRAGLGVGLTLVRTLVELHDGSVTALSDGEGRGSEFIVQLPIQKHVEPPPPVATPTPIPAKSRRILVVEDNVGTAKVMAKLLAKLGSHNVRLVHDGLSALEVAASYRPEIVLLDIGLPRMDGYEVAQRLRQQPDFRNTVIVALTGYGTEEDRRHSAEVGFDRHIVKPASLENLREILAHPRLADA